MGAILKQAGGSCPVWDGLCYDTRKSRTSLILGIGIIWDLVRDAEILGSTQTYYIKI